MKIKEIKPFAFEQLHKEISAYLAFWDIARESLVHRICDWYGS